MNGELLYKHEWKYVGSKDYLSLPPEQFSYKTVYSGDKIYSVYQNEICVFLTKDTEVLCKPNSLLIQKTLSSFMNLLCDGIYPAFESGNSIFYKNWWSVLRKLKMAIYVKNSNLTSFLRTKQKQWIFGMLLCEHETTYIHSKDKISLTMTVD